MSWTAEQDNIMARFTAETTLASGRVDRTDMVNAGKFTRPTINRSDPETSTWARITTQQIPEVSPPLSGASRPGAMGLGASAPSYREGLIVVQLFTAVGLGDVDIKALAELTVAIFHRVNFGTGPVVHGMDGYIVRVGIDPETESWYQYNAIVPYWVQD